MKGEVRVREGRRGALTSARRRCGLLGRVMKVVVHVADVLQIIQFFLRPKQRGEGQRLPSLLLLLPRGNASRYRACKISG